MKIRVVLGSLAIAAAVAGVATVSPAESRANRPTLDDTYKVDPVHSAMVFRIKHLGVSHFYGRFNEIGGSFTFDDNVASELSFDIQVKTASVDTNANGRDNHLKSADFFNAKQFPTISFKSTAVKQTSKETYDVTGDLTLHGVTKSMTVQMEFVGDGDRGQRFGYRAGFDTTFTINRRDFGMDYMPAMLGDKVKIMFGLVGVEEQDDD